MFRGRGGTIGGLRAPLQLVHQWKYGEGEGEEEVEKRRKMERERKKKRLAPPSIMFCIRHYFVVPYKESFDVRI